MSVPAPSARLRFAAELARDDEALDLATAALLLAAGEYPQLSPAPYLQRLDVLAERVHDRLSEETAPLVMLQTLNRVLFVEEGFGGNIDAYYDPRNSFLNDVLDRRLGIPITLSVIYLEVGWRLGLPLAGVSFPRHFLVRFEGESTRYLIDPFEQGRLRFEDEAQELLDAMYGGMVTMKPEFLERASKRGILLRMLRNLKGIYVNARDIRRALTVIDRILILRPDAAAEVRDRGMLLAAAGRPAEAVESLQRYLELSPEADDADDVNDAIERLCRDA